jgi:hypothetical protein
VACAGCVRGRVRLRPRRGRGNNSIAAAAFAGAVLLILLKVISPEEAYAGLRPEVLLLIGGMVVVGLAIEVTGLATAGTALLINFIRPFGPSVALAILYGVTLFATEFLSNAAVAVLITPVAVALAESLGVAPRPFVIAGDGRQRSPRNSVRLSDQCLWPPGRRIQVHGFREGRRTAEPRHLLGYAVLRRASRDIHMKSSR